MSKVKELMSLKGRRAMITGARGVLGSVMADTLAEMGADLILVDQPGTDIGSLAASLQKRWDSQVCYYYCDLEQNDERLELLELIENEHNLLNVLINNAAFVGASDLKGWVTSFEQQTIETWRRALEVNLTAPFHMSQGLVPLLKQSAGASIINIGSIYGEYGPDWELYKNTTMGNPVAYSASKGGLNQLTRWLATTLAPDIRVNAISPGGIFRKQPDIFVKRYENRTPMRRMANEDDFRGATLYLASDLSSYVSGQILSVDGGWGSW